MLMKLSSNIIFPISIIEVIVLPYVNENHYYD
nr:MAG TPA: hypothetical protein [Bacteriophage sp.]